MTFMTVPISVLNLLNCHIVQPNVERFTKHFGAIQINRLELTAHLHSVHNSATFPMLLLKSSKKVVFSNEICSSTLAL